MRSKPTVVCTILALEKSTGLGVVFAPSTNLSPTDERRVELPVLSRFEILISQF